MQAKVWYPAIFLLFALAACAPPADAYAVSLDPAKFVAVVDNPYFPLTPGSRWVYEARSGDEVERIEIEVLRETKLILGIQATILHDTVTVGGVLVEDTFDWFAQDQDGNVWYLGEDVSNYENGEFQDKAGSWEAGVDGAQPGIIMYGDPAAHVGETYQQEYYAGEAEDMATLVSVTERVIIPLGLYENVIHTRDFTPLEPGVEEDKYYAPGVGNIKIVNPATGEEEVLIEYVPGG
jgi:hypothetical protein